MVRVKSGNRSLTIKQAIQDELLGGYFIADMTEKQYKIFQKYLCIRASVISRKEK